MRTKQIMYQVVGTLAFWLFAYLIIEKTEIPIQVPASLGVLAISFYLTIKLWSKSSMVLKIALSWFCVGWLALFSISLLNFLALIYIEQSIIHILLIMVPLFIIGNPEKHIKKA